MRCRITVRGDSVELRGYLDGETVDVTLAQLAAFAAAMKPFGLVVASQAADDYDPFKRDDR